MPWPNAYEKGPFLGRMRDRLEWVIGPDCPGNRQPGWNRKFGVEAGSHADGKMVNEIRKVREAIDRGLASANLTPGGPTIELSPCGRYRLQIKEYDTADGADFAVALVSHAASGQEIATIRRNDSRCFYAWVSRDGHDYLLFPEDLEGQTIIDLTSGRVAGFSSPDDPFIWAEFYPSPNRTKLAVVGCYWACPYQVTVYDFRDPLKLPLPKLAEFVLPDNNAQFAKWGTEAAIRVRSQDGTVHVFDIPEGRPNEPDAATAPAEK